MLLLLYLIILAIILIVILLVIILLVIILVAIILAITHSLLLTIGICSKIRHGITIIIPICNTLTIGKILRIIRHKNSISTQISLIIILSTLKNPSRSQKLLHLLNKIMMIMLWLVHWGRILSIRVIKAIQKRILISKNRKLILKQIAKWWE